MRDRTLVPPMTFRGPDRTLGMRQISFPSFKRTFPIPLHLESASCSGFGSSLRRDSSARGGSEFGTPSSRGVKRAGLWYPLRRCPRPPWPYTAAFLRSRTNDSRRCKFDFRCAPSRPQTLFGLRYPNSRTLVPLTGSYPPDFGTPNQIKESNILLIARGTKVRPCFSSTRPT